MSSERFGRFSWFFVAYNLVVIVWGAFVRASGSGAGCGSHWPLCNGEVVPRAPSLETLIELSHRLTSGLALIGAIVLAIWAFRLFPARHLCRRAALAGLILMLIEGAVGAGLVLFELVGDNDSVARAIYMAVHLVNTFLLLAALTLVADLAVQRDSPAARRPGPRPSAWPLVIALGGMLIVGASGAVAALGDTLFPATDLAAAMRRDLSPTAHWLERLRVLHPLAAAVLGAFLLFGMRAGRPAGAGSRATRLHGWVVGLVILQVSVGLLNIQLLAPVWLQLVHLLLADLLWIVLVLLAAERLGWETRKPS